jgi:hypothetical protein
MHDEFRSLAVGVFDTVAKAERCVEALRLAGFAADDIGIIEPDTQASDGTVADEPSADQDGAAGVSTSARRLGAAGAVIGGLLGAATALVIPGIGPVIAGGVLASALGGAALGLSVVLAGFGMSRPRATLYERQLQQGRTIVTVNVAGKYQVALDILKMCGALWVDSTNTSFGNDSTGAGERDVARGHPVDVEPPAAARPD